MSKPDSDLAEDLLRRLAHPESSASLGRAVVSFLLSQPVSRFVVAEEVPGYLDSLAWPPLAERIIGTHVAAFCRRERERAKDRGDHFRDYLTPEALEFLRRELGRPVVLDRAFVDGLVRQDAVRHLLRSIVEETVHRFVQSLKPGGPEGLFGSLPRGPGMGLFVKVATQIEAQIQRAASAFVQSSLEVLLGRLVQILSTPDTAKRLGGLRLAGFEALCGLSSRRAWALAHKMPLDEALALLPGLLRHNLLRTELRKALVAEVDSLLSAEGEHSIRDLVDARTSGAWQEEGARHFSPFLRDFLASEAFRKWLASSE